MSLFKKKDEDRKAAYKPTSDAAKESAGAGGKGGGEPAKPSYDVGSKKFKQVISDARKEGGVNNDGRFGYGYIDENTGVEVPWYIDMINGGGANAAGQEFVSPFGQQGSIPLPMGMVGRAATAGLNAAGIAPYGYNQPRRYAQAGMQGYPTAAAAPAPTGGGVGGGSPTVTPAPINVPQDFSNLSNAPAIRSGLIGYNPQVVAGTPRPSPSTVAQTTPQMDYLMNIAQQTVMRRFPTMPEADRQMAIQGEYQRLVNSIGM